MTSREERRLRSREQQILDAIEARKTNSQRQADMALGRNRSESDSDSDEQRRRTPLTTNERQARAALGRDS